MMSPRLPLIRDVIEEAEIPCLGIASDPDDDPVEMEEILHPAHLALEDDEMERKRSHLDDVPLHKENSKRDHFHKSETNQSEQNTFRT